MNPPTKTRPDLVDLAAVAGLFSSTVLQQMARQGRSAAFGQLLRESQIADTVPPTTPVRDLLDQAFTEILAQHRNEYVYKTAIAHKILLGRHSLNTAVMLTEFRVAMSKADIVILNGTSTAYEIKSDRDSLARLSSQLDAYLRAFARVNVIASDDHIEKILDTTPEPVGVLRLTRQGSISSVRTAIDDPARIDPATLFDALQIQESERVLRYLGAEIPTVPNTLRHSSLRDLFERENPADLHNAMVRVLCSTRSHAPLADLMNSVPRSLQAAALSTRLRPSNYASLNRALDTPVRAARYWR